MGRNLPYEEGRLRPRVLRALPGARQTQNPAWGPGCSGHGCLPRPKATPRAERSESKVVHSWRLWGLKYRGGGRGVQRERRVTVHLARAPGAGRSWGPGSLAEVLLVTLDGFLDAEQHGGQPLVQPRDAVILLHCLRVAVHVLLLVGVQQLLYQLAFPGI